MSTARRQRTGTKATPVEPRLRRVGFYTRISTDEDHQKYSLDAQKDRLEAFCTSQYGDDWTLHKLYRDTESGTHMNRPGLEEMLKDASDRDFDILLVFRVDRLSRKVRELALMVDDLTKNGVALKSITEPFDTSSAAGKMMLQMLGVFAEFEHATIVERTKVGMHRKAKSGKWVGGSVPLGFSLMDGQLVSREDEAETVRKVFARYVELESLLGVSEELGKQNLRSRSGRPFSKQTLRFLLGNPVYAGKIRYGDEIFDGTHEAIIDDAKWTSVQQLLKRNGGRERAARSRSGAILSGIVLCGQCESAMTTQHAKRGNRRYGYYVCQTAQKRGASACPGSRVATRDLEAFVVERIKDIGRDQALVRDTIEAARAALVVRRPEIETELRHLGIYRDQLGKQRRNLVDAVAKAGPKAHGLLEKIGEVEVALTDVNGKIGALEAEVQGLEGQSIDEADLRAALASFTPVWDQLFPAERARIMQLLLQSVTYNAGAGEVEITFRPGGVRALAAEGEQEASA